MSKSIKLTLLFFILSSMVKGKETDSLSFIAKFHSIGVATGINQLKENNLHAKVHSGPLFGLRYSRDKIRKQEGYKQKITKLFLEAKYSPLKTKYEGAPTSLALNFSLGYRYSILLITKNNIQYFLGPALKLNYTLAYYSNWDDSHLYWADFISAGINNTLLYTINGNKNLTFSMDVPLLTLTSRPVENRQYKIDDLSLKGIVKNLHDNRQVGSLNVLFFCDPEIEYSYFISPGIQQSICYSLQFIFVKNRYSQDFKNLFHGITFKVKF